MNSSIQPTSQNSNSLTRRDIARDEIARVSGFGKLMYLMHSPNIRKVVLPNGKIAHSAIDVVNVLGEFKGEINPNKLWRDTKKRMLREDKDIGQFLSNISLPLWDDKSSRNRASDVLTDGGLVLLIFELHSPLSNEIRHAIAKAFERYPSQYHEQIISELERDVGRAGTIIRLEMESIYEEGDYDNPNQPPGCPD